MMRCPRHLTIYRRKLQGQYGDHSNGIMDIPVRGLRIMFSNGGDWEHVSVSREDRCPTWEEMCWVKQEFFGAEETVMQLHVPASEHVNCHPYCLHLWRPLTTTIPRPPATMVGP